MKKLLIYLFIFLMLASPALSLAAGKWGLIPCDNVEVECNFSTLMILVNTVISFIFLKLVIPIAAIMFFYAGFLMVTSGGSTESRTKAKSIFKSTVFGLIFAAASWLIVRTILNILGFQDTGIGL